MMRPSITFFYIFERIDLFRHRFFGQAQVLFDHFIKHLDLPAFALDRDDVFICRIDVCRQQGQPVLFRLSHTNTSLQSSRQLKATSRQSRMPA
jgi:hypothetical protein